LNAHKARAESPRGQEGSKTIMDWVNLLGYAAAASVLATFCMRTMIPLRILALVSNVLFCLYGYLDNLYPVLILHLVLFPVSLYRLIQFQRLVHELQVVDPADLSIQSWIPHMKLRRMKAGETLILQGTGSTASITC